MNQADMTGERRGRLRIIEQAERPAGTNSYSRDLWWKCKCKCGNVCVKSRTYLRNSRNPHCGCLTEENRRKARKMAEEAYRMNLAVRKNPGDQQTTNANIYVREEKCPVCKKTFEVLSTDWVYRIGDKRCCSWGCQRKAEKELELKKRSRDELR